MSIACIRVWIKSYVPWIPISDSQNPQITALHVRARQRNFWNPNFCCCWGWHNKGKSNDVIANTSANKYKQENQTTWISHRYANDCFMTQHWGDRSRHWESYIGQWNLCFQSSKILIIHGNNSPCMRCGGYRSVRTIYSVTMSKWSHQCLPLIMLVLWAWKGISFMTCNPRVHHGITDSDCRVQLDQRRWCASIL